MSDAPSPAAVRIRPARSDDAEGIAHVYLESAEYHAGVDPERYSVCAFEPIAARYRAGLQHAPDAGEESITLVAEMSGGIVGFVDTRLYRSPDPMHREILYCNIVEIAVSRQHQSQGIGGQLLQTAEEWGRGQGAQLALLEYNAANQRAGEFYRRRTQYRVASITAIKRLW
ncbi:MAG TPA: GNAT family N-acetyltransferase [Terriglobales bacterium]|nr:GNAT family N-acetyltransferase [Terriglobales bacterium]